MIFIDTGAFIARYLANDQHHEAATRAWGQLSTTGRRHYTSNFVLDETITLLGRWSSYAFAAERARNLYASRVLEALRPSHDDEFESIALRSHEETPAEESLRLRSSFPSGGVRDLAVIAARSYVGDPGPSSK